MKPKNNSLLLPALQGYIKTASFITVGVGLAVLLGWAFDIAFLKSILPGAATMKPNTAICFVALGAALALLRNTDAPLARRRAAQILAGFVLVLGLLTLAEYAFGWDLGIDQLVFRDLQTPAHLFPGRPSLITAALFAILALGVLLIESNSAQYLFIGAFYLSLLAIIGYLFGRESLYRLGGYSSIAIHTAILFFILSIAFLAARPDRTVIRTFMSPLPGAVAIRVMVLVMLVIVPLAAWLDQRIENAGMVDEENAAIVLVILRIFILSIAIYLGGRIWLRAEEKNASQARLLENVNDAVLATDENFIITFWNRAAENLYGYPADQVLGRKVQEIIHSEFSDEQRAAAVQSLKDSGGYRTEVLQSRRDGHPFWVDGNTFTVRDSTGHVTGYVSVNRDITERKQAEEELSAARDLFQTIFRNSPVATTFSKLADRTIVDVNRATEKLFGYSRDELIGKPSTNFDYWLNPAERQRAYEIVLASGRLWDFEFSFKTKSGTTGQSVLYIETVVQRGEKYFLSIFIDITERKRAEQALRESEAKFSTLFKKAPTAISLAILPDATFVDVNETFEQLFGYTKQEMIGKTSLQLGIQPDEQVRAQIFAKLKERNSVHDLETALRTKSGEIRNFILNVDIVDVGSQQYLFNVAQDITERKRTEDAMRESEEKFKYVFDHSPIGKSITHLDGAIHVNAAFCRMLGYAQDELANTKWREISHPDDNATTQRNIDALIAGEKESTRFIKRYFHKNGSIVWVDVSTALRRDAEGKPLYFMTSVIDITERKRAEDEIRQLNDELEARVRARTAELTAANQELEAFSYSVSHDLRAPLRYISGFIGLLNKNAPNLDDKNQHYLATIAQSAQQMGALIDDLLAFSRLGRAEMNKTNVALDPLVREVIRELEPQTAGRDIVWEIGSLPNVYADRTLLKSVLMNLLSNAVKYTGTRARAIIEIGTKKGNRDEIVCFVRDNGVGFDMQYVNKLFGLFQRLHRVNEFQGTGVGLASVRRIVHRHGGRTWAEGELERGATFYFSFPNPNGGEHG